MNYDASYPKFVTTASMSASEAEAVEISSNKENLDEEAPLEDDEEEDFDDEIEDQEDQDTHNDVSEKLNSLFNINTDNEGDK